jgi:O-antigen ligase
MRLALGFCLAVAVLPLLQLIPLPPWLWTWLPNRQPSAEAFDILGRAIPWMPISVSPAATWLSALSLLPPLAVFLSTLLLSNRERRWLTLIVLAVGVLSVLVGLIQVAQGETSPLRFFGPDTEAVGFFANRNHFASLIYCLIVFALGWIVPGIGAVRVSHNQKPKGKVIEYEYDTVSIIAMIGGFTVLVILLAGQLMARSRAGLGLTIIALFGLFAFGFSNRSLDFGAAKKGLIGAIMLVLIFSVQFGLYRVFERVPDQLGDDRPVIAKTTIEAAKAYMPIGSGLGTFVPVYAMFEKPEDAKDTYVNRAHNDLLEVWLETGVVGLALVALFTIWLVWRSIAIWRNERPMEASELDWSLARAATVVTALLIAHSLVDFPLRTGAMMAVLAFACALMIEAPVGVERREEMRPEMRRTQPHANVRAPAIASPRPTAKLRTAKLKAPGKASDQPSPPASQRWEADIEWPKEWSKSTNLPSHGDKDVPKKE